MFFRATLFTSYYQVSTFLRTRKLKHVNIFISEWYLICTSVVTYFYNHTIYQTKCIVFERAVHFDVHDNVPSGIHNIIRHRSSRSEITTASILHSWCMHWLYWGNAGRPHRFGKLKLFLGNFYTRLCILRVINSMNVFFSLKPRCKFKLFELNREELFSTDTCSTPGGSLQRLMA